MIGTHYQILAVKKKATAAEVKRAYRRLVKMAHPDVDKTSGAADRFMAIQEAYEVLSDPAKRAAYDVSLRAKKTAPAGGANPSAGAPPRSTSPPSPPPSGAAGAGARQRSSGPPPKPPRPPQPAPPNWPLILVAVGRVLWARARPYAIGIAIGLGIAAIVSVASAMKALASLQTQDARSTAPPPIAVAETSAPQIPSQVTAPGHRESPERGAEMAQIPPESDEKSPSETASEEVHPNEDPVIDVTGDWKGSYDFEGFTIPFSMTLSEDRSRISGKSFEFDGDAHREAIMTGSTGVGRLVLAKRYISGGPGVCYTATEIAADAMSGRWDAMGYAGEWRAERAAYPRPKEE